MIAATLLERAQSLRLGLEPREGGGLVVRPASRLPPDLAADLRGHNHEIIALLTGLATTALPPPNRSSQAEAGSPFPPKICHWSP